MDEVIAYFSMEIGINPKMPTYSGGLGVLAGDTVKSFADLKVPVVAVTLLFRKGYFQQKLHPDGGQEELPVDWNIDEFLKPLPQKAEVIIEGRPVRIKPYVYYYEGFTGHKNPVIFLDTDITGNSDYDRKLSHYLYGGDERYRLCQEVVLGIGGVKILDAMGYDVKKYHMNEGHSALLVLELLSKEGNLDSVREKCVFTTHTPVPAGHDSFDVGLSKSVLGGMFNLCRDSALHEGKLNMTHLALEHSMFVNGVAKKHGEVSRSMFPGYHVESITNGVHSATWTCPSFTRLFDKMVPGWHTDPFCLRYIAGIHKEDIWEAHMEAKREMIDLVNKNGVNMDYDTFTIGYARRITAYKRPWLLFVDKERLKAIARKHKIQVVFSGKAHPRDWQGKDLIKSVYSLSEELKEDIKIAFVEGYNMDIAKKIVSGVDIWLNTPLRPMEASGTSGMKAAHNGVPHFSVLDGWWIEGHIEDITGWAIGPDPKKGEHEDEKDKRDAEDMYKKLENRILPLFYEDRENWIRKMRSAIAFNASFFNTHRMVQQYVTNAYI